MRVWQRLFLVLACLALLLSSACRRSSSGERRAATVDAAPPADVRDRGHHVLGLYFTRDPGAGPMETFRREAATTRFKVLGRKQAAERLDPDTVYMAAPDLAEAPPPSGQQLELFGRGFTAQDRAQAEKIAAVRVMAFSLREPMAVRDADQLAERVASAAGAYLFDTATREIFTLPAWRSRRLAAWNGDRPRVASHVTVHAYREGAAYRAVSLGMEKFGVPDVAVNGIRGEDLQRVDTLVQLTLQSLVEQGKTTAELTSKSGAIAVHLARSTPAEGDAANRLLEVADPLVPLLDRVGNAEELHGIQGDDPELAAAVAQVRARVPTLSRRFAAGLGATGRLRVKAMFENEGTWVEVKTWQNGELRGPLLDHPQVAKKLVAGQTVDLRDGDVIDYLLTGVDAPEGPFLDEILERKGRRHSP